MAIGHVYHEINHDGTTENLLSDEERFLGTRRSTNPKNSRIGFLRALLRQYWCILDSAGIVTIIALSVALITRHAPDSDAIGGDVTGFSPSCKLSRLTNYLEFELTNSIQFRSTFIPLVQNLNISLTTLLTGSPRRTIKHGLQ